MGYNAQSIGGLKHLIDMGVLFPHCAILEFGAQEAQGDPEELRQALQEIADYLKLEVTIPALEAPVDMSAMFRLMGFTHKAIDVNYLNGSEFFDLNTQRVPARDYGKYDWVNNEGTTEHVVNQMNAFRAAHDYCKPGGYISNSCPIMGWVDHGLMNATPKFWAILAGENKYRTAYTHLEVTERSRPLPEWYASWTVVGEFTYPDVWVNIIFQKQTGNPFVIPLDHLESDADGKIAARLKRNASPLPRFSQLHTQLLWFCTRGKYLLMQKLLARAR